MASDRRPYESPLRRQQAEVTRRQIVEAGCALVQSRPTWGWKDVTFRAIAGATGLSERTVYRYFANERDLHHAVLGGLAEQAGVSGPVAVADLPARVGAFLSWYSAHALPPERTAAARTRSRADLAGAVEGATDGWDEIDRTSAAAALDLLTDVRLYEGLMRDWNLSPDEAVPVAVWLTGLVTEAVLSGRRPSGFAGPSR